MCTPAVYNPEYPRAYPPTLTLPLRGPLYDRDFVLAAAAAAAAMNGPL